MMKRGSFLRELLYLDKENESGLGLKLQKNGEKPGFFRKKPINFEKSLDIGLQKSYNSSIFYSGGGIRRFRDEKTLHIFRRNLL